MARVATVILLSSLVSGCIELHVRVGWGTISGMLFAPSGFLRIMLALSVFRTIRRRGTLLSWRFGIYMFGLCWRVLAYGRLYRD